jgi:hypothetical protein
LTVACSKVNRRFKNRRHFAENMVVENHSLDSKPLRLQV